MQCDLFQVFILIFETAINRMAPLVSLQKKVYMSILRKELSKLLAIASGGSGAQSLHNIVSNILLSINCSAGVASNKLPPLMT